MSTAIIRKYLHRIHVWLVRAVKKDEESLRHVPDHILSLTVFLSMNVLMQGVADLVLKFLSYTPVLPSMPWRTDFLFLTAISVLMGYRTLTGMRQRRFDVTRNSIELGVLVEVALIVGDTQFVFEQQDSIPYVALLRLPFIILTTINVIILLYTYHVLKFREWF